MDRSQNNSGGLWTHLCPRKWKLAALVVSSVVAIGPLASAIELDLSGAKPPTVNLAPAADTGTSVVVAKRHEPLADEAASNGALEPISDYAEEEPELADPEPVEPPASKAEEAATATPASESVTQSPAPAATVAEAPVAKPAAQAQAKPTVNPDQPSSFRGVTPGLTTRAELKAAWGAAQSERTTPSGTVAAYDVPPFKSVELLIAEDVVRVVRAELGEPQNAGQLAVKLKAGELQAVEILDPTSGQVAAIAYPEKGMLLLVTPADDTPSAQLNATHLVLQPLDAEAFALRAENRGPLGMTGNNRDLARARRIDPQNAHVQWLSAQAFLASGQAQLAATTAKQAVDLEPTNSAYRLCWAHALEVQGDFDPAVLETRTVIDDSSAPDVVRAAAFSQMGRLASLGDAQIAEKSIGFHTKAIEIADRLTRSTDTTERRLAKQVLVDSHLCVAKEIARRDYARKNVVVGEWVGRASGIAEEAIERDGGSLLLRLQVARDAMGAIADIKPALDPKPWVKEAQETADTLLKEHTDPLVKARIEWDLGETYYQAVRASHSRLEADQALGYGTLAIEHLSAGAEPRTTDPESSRTVGQLYFYLGAVNAVHKQDHTEAVAWYDKAYPLLVNDERKSDLIAPRRAGETLVSMAVSYWQQNQKPRAVELTASGAKLMESAVAAGVLDEASLSVPYGNLATMQKELGDNAEATRYANLARGARGTAVAATAGPPTTAPTRVAGAQPSGDRPTAKKPVNNSAVGNPPQPTAPAVVRNRTAAKMARPNVNVARRRTNNNMVR